MYMKEIVFGAVSNRILRQIFNWCLKIMSRASKQRKKVVQGINEAFLLVLVSSPPPPIFYD